MRRVLHVPFALIALLVVGCAQVSRQPAPGSVALRILDPDGGPVTSARVQVVRCYTVAHVGRVFTGADCADRVLSPRDFVDGVAVLDRLPSGVLAFVVESKPHPASLSRVFEVPGEAAEITVRLTRGAVLEGVVTDEDGKPVADATVRTEPHPCMFEPPGCGASPLVLGTRASVRTDREGRYRIEGIAHGKYRVFAAWRDHCGVCRDVDVAEDRTIAVAAFAIPRGCVVEGVATLDGASVAGIRVTLQPDDKGVVQAEVEQVPAAMHGNQRAVWSDVRAVTDSRGTFQLARRSPALGELRRNALFNLTTGVIECEMDFLIASSSNPSTGWEFYTQPAPMPQSCQMRWFVAADGHVEYFDGPAFNLIVTSFVVAKDVWHHARTVVDVLQNTTQIHVDGVLVGTGQPISPYGSVPAHGFTQINVHGAGNDAIWLDNFTMRERIAPHGLSVDLQRLPVNVRSVMDFHLAGGPLLANRPYALLGSISGTTPGTPIGTTVLPLVVDGFAGIVMSGFASLPGFLGTFNGSGAASAQYDTQIAVPPFLLGLNMHFAYLTVDTFDAASEPVLVRVTNQ